MSRDPMKPRSFRVSDKAWASALEAADEKDEILAEEIRKFVERYPKIKKGTK